MVDELTADDDWTYSEIELPLVLGGYETTYTFTGRLLAEELATLEDGLSYPSVMVRIYQRANSEGFIGYLCYFSEGIDEATIAKADTLDFGKIRNNLAKEIIGAERLGVSSNLPPKMYGSAYYKAVSTLDTLREEGYEPAERSDWREGQDKEG